VIRGDLAFAGRVFRSGARSKTPGRAINIFFRLPQVAGKNCAR
jgi:hypothetical protein